MFVAAWVTTAQPQLGVVSLFGLTVGQTHEIVYNEPASSVYLSELIWPTPLSANVRLEAYLDWGDLSTRAGVGVVHALTSGIMTDDDFDYWFNGKVYNVHSSTPVYALADAEAWLEQLWNLGTDLGTYRPLIGVKARKLAWESWTNKEGDYQVWTPVDGSATLENQLFGLVITFRQFRIVPYLGLEGAWNWGNRNLTLGVRASPWLMALDTDFHVPQKVYFDTALGGVELEPRAEISFAVAPGIELGLRTSYTWSAYARGDIVAVAARSQDSGTLSQDQAGTGWQSVNIDVFLKN